MRAHSKLLALLLVIALGHVHAAEDPAPFPVTLRFAGSDLVGLALSVALREELAAAPQLRFEESGLSTPRIVVIVATVDGSVEDPEKQTAASVNVVYDADALPLNGYLITAMVQVCGITRTYECAREIVGTVTSALDKLRVEHADLWLSLQPQPP